MRFSRVLLSVMFIAAAMTLGAVSGAAQTWWVQSADYGAGNQRQDVTDIVRRLVNGPSFKVTNYNLGGDPAVGRDKTLRIVAKDASGMVRDFYYQRRPQGERPDVYRRPRLGMARLARRPRQRWSGIWRARIRQQ